MSDRRDYYFRQVVQEGELDQGFADLENADRNWTLDVGLFGIFYGMGVAQAGSPNLTVVVGGPGAAYDQLGQRCLVATNQTVDVSKDSSNVSTAVSTNGKEKKVSVFVQFSRALSDPRVDGNAATVYFQRSESFQFVVAQGAEANVGFSTPPALMSNAVLLADITLIFNQTQVVNGDISTSRRQDCFVYSGSPRSIRRGRVGDALSDLLSYYNTLVGGTGDTIAATRINYAGGGSWADASTNPAATVEAQLDKIITDLGGASGYAKVGNAGGLNATNAWSGANTFSDVTATGTNKYKLASRSLVRVTQSLPIAATDSIAGVWKFTNHGEAHQVADDSAGQSLTFGVDVPNAAVITRIDVAVNGSTHANLTNVTLPNIYLVTEDTSGNFVQVGLAADSSGTAGAYDGQHNISITGLSHTVDKTTKRYHVIVDGETGAAFVAGLIVQSVKTTFTTTAQDDGAG